ncbi:ribonucleoside-diphosphate reductase subunit alpha [Parvimonas sp. D2]|uniref:ribonucleoside-diphosphate reductase subunit alpha n=1 Tax=unclassified Parvimonas TaxID=1151464 RepID=UPI002B4708D8|nr:MULTISPECIES: ribonucleoside-diphosphate reductase subunit alpha [unclassified Parvimonas]MEB3012482.1 ribonucleoside-diphosphate reductase subunit alpha [Parvimonas sp. D2]MEB3087975.1 ribonucleoside-diphosphate reductase subunit alpha [Parvimonas sp. D4]
MRIIKRDLSEVSFDISKIENAIYKAFISVGDEDKKVLSKQLAQEVFESILQNKDENSSISVEEIQDYVEKTLTKNNHYETLKSYILYREKRNSLRKELNSFREYIEDENLIEVLAKIQKDFSTEGYELDRLFRKFLSFVKPSSTLNEKVELLIKASSELTSKENPNWEYISARIYAYKIHKEISNYEKEWHIVDFKSKIQALTKANLYGEYILENYSSNDIDELEKYIDNSRDELFTYSSLDLVYKRYLICDSHKKVIETMQEMFMGIAMHLAIPEKDKVSFAKKVYDVLSNLKATVATPTMSNARKPFHQLSSCFIDTVPDTLKGIYRSIDNFAQVSKHGGGMGLYFGKVRASGSDIRGFKGVAGGVIRWIKLANDTAVAVDQLGVRQGSCAVYLDVWHRDIPEFLNLRTNNGDDRMKAHDVFPAICFPNLFWRLAKENINSNWYLFCPHEVKEVMGFCLEDFYGEEWEEKYRLCIKEPRLDKRVLTVKDLVKLILKSQVETGTPFIFNRDNANNANPNSHNGMIYSSNLCTEIMQNMKEILDVEDKILQIDGEDHVVTDVKAGDFVVCNLASLVLGNIDLKNDEEMEFVVSTMIRALDNVIDLNYYPTPFAKITNSKYRAIGLGTSGYHHALVKNKIMWQTEEHLEFMDKVYEKINYFAIKESSKIAEEKGSYKYFEGSEWQNGKYFEKREYNSKEWIELKEKVAKNGLRNAYLLAVAPTGSTSIIAGTTAGVDPVMMRYFLEEKKGSIIPRVAPDLTPETFWLYENAHEVDQTWSIRAGGVRQRHIDQGQSLNLYITTDYKMSQILNLLILSCEVGLKSIYYIRSKSLDIEECDSCSA